MTYQAKIQPTPRERVLRMAHDALEKHSDVVEATEALLAQVRDDPEALRAMMAPYELRAARELIGKTVRSDRNRIWNHTNDNRIGGSDAAGEQARNRAPERATGRPPARENTGANASGQATGGPPERASEAPPAEYTRPTAPDARVASLAAGVVRAGLMDFRLHDGSKLGDADKAKVSAAAEHWGKQARDMSWKSRWLAKIADKVKAKQTVRDALDETTLRKLREETNNA